MLPEAEKAKSASYLTPPPDSGLGELLHTEGELNRILQEQLARLRSSWRHESSWHGSR